MKSSSEFRALLPENWEYVDAELYRYDAVMEMLGADILGLERGIFDQVFVNLEKELVIQVETFAGCFTASEFADAVVLADDFEVEIIGDGFIQLRFKFRGIAKEGKTKYGNLRLV